MDFEVLGLVFLKSFSKLQEKCDEIDKKVKTQCLSLLNIEKIFNSVSKLNKAKRALCNVKVMVIETLKKLKHREFIIDKFINNLSANKICSKYGIREDSFYRKSKREEKNFVNMIVSLYDKNVFLEIYKDSSFIRNKYNYFMHDKGEEYLCK